MTMMMEFLLLTNFSGIMVGCWRVTLQKCLQFQEIVCCLIRDGQLSGFCVAALSSFSGQFSFVGDDVISFDSRKWSWHDRLPEERIHNQVSIPNLKIYFKAYSVGGSNYECSNPNAFRNQNFFSSDFKWFWFRAVGTIARLWMRCSIAFETSKIGTVRLLPTQK